MKTFKEFLEEAYLVEMRKEDKVKGEKKTPLYVSKTSGRVVKNPETGRSEVKKSTRTSLSPRAATGRIKQGMKDPLNIYGQPETYGATRHAHGGGGSGAKAPGRKRGVGKLEQQKIDKAQRERGERPVGSGTSPAYKVALRKSKRTRLDEMRKEDKVAGKKKTPLYLTKKYKTVQKAPEGSGKKWETRTIEKKQINPTASLGRFKQGKEGGAPAIQAGGTHGGPTMGYKPHTHGEGGSGRGVKKERGAKTEPKPGTTATDRVQAKRKAVDSWRGQYGGRYSIWGSK